MPQMRIREAAGFLGVSDDTVRRLIDNGSLAATPDSAGRKTIDGYELARFARSQASTAPNPLGVGSSARNRFVGLVTDIRMDTVMAQVELQCGPFRVVSLMSSDAVRDLALELGSVAVAVVKSTTVIVETPPSRGES
jgi:molybdopterin-binding protein